MQFKYSSSEHNLVEENLPKFGRPNQRRQNLFLLSVSLPSVDSTKIRVFVTSAVFRHRHDAAVLVGYEINSIFTAILLLNDESDRPIRDDSHY